MTAAANDFTRPATALDCALGWLEVAALCIERAAMCAALGQVEAEEHYLAMRARLDEQIREGAYFLKIERVVLSRLALERGEEPWSP